MRKKQRRSIQRLYNTIRASSSTSVNCNANEPKPQSPKRKRRNLEHCSNSPNAKRKPADDSIIVIKDDETPKKCNAKPQTSTPNNNCSNNLTDLNISNVSTGFPVINLTNQIADLTKEINKSSYLTIDLTTETLDRTNKNTTEPTVIDLDSTSDTQDCTVIPKPKLSNTSCDTDVTVIENTSTGRKKLQEKKMREFAEGISKMNASDKGKLLEMITAKIFNGCNVQRSGASASGINLKQTKSRAVETAEDAFIKEVILGQSTSRNSFGSNIYNPERDIKAKSGLRMVVIDGSNVAMEHGHGKQFSVKGLKICLDYFLKRGHIVKAFVPRFRCKFGKSTEPRLLDELERRGLVVYTPSREVQGRTITPYDDRYIVQCAAEFDGVIVSGDNYRDLLLENPKWRHVIERRLLPFTWVNDMIMFPKDPLGRNGPTLEQFLRHQPDPNVVK